MYIIHTSVFVFSSLNSTSDNASTAEKLLTQQETLVSYWRQRGFVYSEKEAEKIKQVEDLTRILTQCLFKLSELYDDVMKPLTFQVVVHLGRMKATFPADKVYRFSSPMSLPPPPLHVADEATVILEEDYAR